MARSVSKEITIAQALAIEPAIAPVLFEIGMHCIGCPSSAGETLEEAAFVHGVDADELIAKMNAVIAEKDAAVSASQE